MSGNDTRKNSEFAINFIKEDYFAKVEYLTKHFERLWGRFNYFLALVSALVAGYGWAWSQEYVEMAFSISLLGIVSSLIWFLTAKEDRRLVELYRDRHLAQAFNLCKEHINQDALWIPSELSHVGEKDGNPPTMDLFSITRLPMIAAVVSLLVWVLALGLEVPSISETPAK